MHSRFSSTLQNAPNGRSSATHLCSDPFPAQSQFVQIANLLDLLFPQLGLNRDGFEVWRRRILEVPFFMAARANPPHDQRFGIVIVVRPDCSSAPQRILPSTAAAAIRGYQEFSAVNCSEHLRVRSFVLHWLGCTRTLCRGIALACPSSLEAFRGSAGHRPAPLCPLG